jgi:hypothetical protein
MIEATLSENSPIVHFEQVERPDEEAHEPNGHDVQLLGDFAPNSIEKKPG